MAHAVIGLDGLGLGDSAAGILGRAELGLAGSGDTILDSCL